MLKSEFCGTAKERLDVQKRKTSLKRLLNGLAALQRKLNTRRYKQPAYVEQRLATLQQGQPAPSLVDIALTGNDGALTLTFHLNRQRLAEAQALDGRYALVTNAAHLSADEALALFKGQDRVEKRFRAVKGPLQVHPLLVHTGRRLEGLVFITLLALLVQAILERAASQRGLAFTAQRLVGGFRTWQAVDLRWADGSLQRRAAEATPFQAQVLQALGWPTPEAYTALAPFPD